MSIQTYIEKPKTYLIYFTNYIIRILIIWDTMGFLEIDDSTVTSKVAGLVYPSKHVSTSEKIIRYTKLRYNEISNWLVWDLLLGLETIRLSVNDPNISSCTVDVTCLIKIHGKRLYIAQWLFKDPRIFFFDQSQNQ